MTIGENKAVRFPAFDKPYVYLLWVIVALSISTVLLFSLPSDILPDIQGHVQSLALSLTAGAIPAYLTAVLVDGMHRRREAKRHNKFRKLAYRDIRKTLSSELGLFYQWYVASVEQVPENKPESYDELFEEELFEAVKHLDLFSIYRTVNTAGEVQKGYLWIDHSWDTLEKSPESVDNIIRKYGLFLEAGLVKKLDEFSSSDFRALIRELRKVRDRKVSLEGDPMEMLSEHIEIMFELMEKLEDEDALEELDRIDKEAGAWRDDVYPSPGTARLNKENKD